MEQQRPQAKRDPTLPVGWICMRCISYQADSSAGKCDRCGAPSPTAAASNPFLDQPKYAAPILPIPSVPIPQISSSTLPVSSNNPFSSAKDTTVYPRTTPAASTAPTKQKLTPKNEQSSPKNILDDDDVELNNLHVPLFWSYSLELPPKSQGATKPPTNPFLSPLFPAPDDSATRPPVGVTSTSTPLVSPSGKESFESEQQNHNWDSWTIFEQQQWSCSYCTFLNHAALEFCEVCERPRDPTKHRKSKGSGRSGRSRRTVQPAKFPITPTPSTKQPSSTSVTPSSKGSTPKVRGFGEHRQLMVAGRHDELVDKKALFEKKKEREKEKEKEGNTNERDGSATREKKRSGSFGGVSGSAILTTSSTKTKDTSPGIVRDIALAREERRKRLLETAGGSHQRKALSDLGAPTHSHSPGMTSSSLPQKRSHSQRQKHTTEDKLHLSRSAVHVRPAHSSPSVTPTHTKAQGTSASLPELPISKPYNFQHIGGAGLAGGGEVPRKSEDASVIEVKRESGLLSRLTDRIENRGTTLLFHQKPAWLTKNIQPQSTFPLISADYKKILKQSSRDLKQRMKEVADAYAATEQVKIDEAYWLSKTEQVIAVQAVTRRWLAMRHYVLHKKRQRVALEVYTSELSYVESLSELYQFQLLLERENLLSEKKLKRVFSELKPILLYAQELLKSLEERIQTGWSAYQQIGDLFIAMEPFFKLYLRYITQYDLALLTFRNAVEKSAPFEKRTKEVWKASKLDVESILIMPVQRLPRYILLLSELLKNTPPCHCDYHNLLTAHNLMKRMAENANETKKQHENYQAMVRIYEMLDPKYEELIQPHRTFKGAGLLLQVDTSKKLARNQKKVRYVFLFNDMLLLTKIHHIPKERYRLKVIIFLSSFIKITAHPSLPIEGAELLFMLRHRSGSLVFAARNPEEKMSWVLTLEGCLSQATKVQQSRDIEKRGGSGPASVVTNNEDKGISKVVSKGEWQCQYCLAINKEANGHSCVLCYTERWRTK